LNCSDPQQKLCKLLNNSYICIKEQHEDIETKYCPLYSQAGIKQRKVSTLMKKGKKRTLGSGATRVAKRKLWRNNTTFFGWPSKLV